jgi:hypothetical protein
MEIILKTMTLWDFKFSRRRVWCSELSSAIYCRVKWLSTDVSEVHTASIIRESHTVNLSGEATLRCIRRFESLRIKKAKHFWPLSFLLRCRDQGTIPRFLQFHHYIHSEAAERIYHRTSFSLLRERIHDTRRALDGISRALLGLHLRLAGRLSVDDWSLLDRITFERAAQVAAVDKARQCSKFERLHGAQHRATQADHRKTVINLNSIPLEDAAYSALSKGLNYAVSPAALLIEDFLTGVERAIRSLPVEVAEQVRQETVRILKVSNKPRDNLSRAEEGCTVPSHQRRPHSNPCRQGQRDGDPQHHGLQWENLGPSQGPDLSEIGQRPHWRCWTED